MPQLKASCKLTRCTLRSYSGEALWCCSEQDSGRGLFEWRKIAASLLPLHPELLSGAILFRGMVPLTPDSAPDLQSAKVLVGSGKHDPIIPYKEGDALARLLASFGAEVEAYWDHGGHELGMDDAMAGRNWLRRNFSGSGVG